MWLLYLWHQWVWLCASEKSALRQMGHECSWRMRLLNHHPPRGKTTALMKAPEYDICWESHGSELWPWHLTTFSGTLWTLELLVQKILSVWRVQSPDMCQHAATWENRVDKEAKRVSSQEQVQLVSGLIIHHLSQSVTHTAGHHCRV